MDNTSHIIGLTELLDEVNRDLDELVKKHAGDYSTRNITMWWDLERERLLVRHSPASLVRKFHRARGLKRILTYFSAGWLTMIVVQTAVGFWIG